ncbi:MAG: RluA family pseudouridine synthase [Campylobacteraceae bacterium]|nr:RluA family pseudouridine synthase [Campylobacteraceae bacterium]
MPYIFKDFVLKEPIKAWAFLTRELGFSMREAQRTIDRKQLLQNGLAVKRKSDMIEGAVTLLAYEPRPRGLLPICENDFFAVFDKPSGVLAHPRDRATEYSLNDEIKYLYGKNANIVHRLDKETSGLLMVSKNKNEERGLKKLFEDKNVRKEYVALVNGELKEPMVIDAPIMVNSNYDEIKLKVCIDARGKKAVTEIFPMKYFKNLNATLIKAVPKSGRQHQIRAHLFHVEHSIMGDPIYGVDTKTAAMYLDGEMSKKSRINLTGASRVLLHAYKLEFDYKETAYSFKSAVDIETEFINATLPPPICI